MSLLTLQNAQLAFGDAPLLDGLEFNILPGERVCIVGRNGAGKSTLMKVIAGELQLDDGRRHGSFKHKKTGARPVDLSRWSAGCGPQRAAVERHIRCDGRVCKG